MNFNENVWKLCKQIPKGHISTYKKIAEAMNSKACRAVGNALKKNKHPDRIPCYKIVKNNGELGGYSLGIKEKIRRLKKEGIKVKNNKVVNFERILYKF